MTNICYTASNGTGKSFHQLPDQDKDTVRALLYIMDKCSVGDAAYHEMSMIVDGLPRSYLIKQCRTSLNSMFHISRTPGKHPGAQMSFKEELRAQIRKRMEHADLGTQRVRIAGDGAKMSRIANFIVLSFALLSDGEQVMSAKGNHTVGIISGSEDYDVMKVSCKELFGEINELVEMGEIEVDGNMIPLEFFLSGDYKFLLLILGMNSAISNYACVYCKIHKQSRWDTSKQEDYYWSDDNKRTLAENKELANKSVNHFGCIRQPLLNIPIENVRIDELHLFLRVTDILERNLITGAIERDKRDNFSKAPSARTNTNLQSVIDAINSCGVSFSVWQKRDADGKATEHYDWTSMVGGEKKKVLRSIPVTFPQILRPEYCDTIIQIWKGFDELYQIFSAWEPSQPDIDSFFQKATEWVRLFLSLGGKLPGYEMARITPYMHILIYHVAKFLKDDCNSLKSFTGQGVEKINDIVRCIYHNKSNRHDACKEAILALKRIDDLQEFERKPNQYMKRNELYWKERRKRPRLCVDPREDDEVPLAESVIDGMTVSEIKEKLKELNIQTRVRRLDKLKEILKNAIAINADIVN